MEVKGFKKSQIYEGGNSEVLRLKSHKLGTNKDFWGGVVKEPDFFVCVL